MMYVDGFKMAGLASNLEAGWKSITDGIKLAGIGPASTYLGREHATCESTVDGKPARGTQYKMQPLVESCADAYRKLVGKPDLHLPRVDTPFLGDASGGNAPNPKEDEWKHYTKENAWCRIHNASRCALPVHTSSGGRGRGS